MNLVEFRTDTGLIVVNPTEVMCVFEADSYRHRGPAIGIMLRGQNKALLVYGDTPAEVAGKLAAGNVSDLRTRLAAYTEELRAREVLEIDAFERVADEIEEQFLR